METCRACGARLSPGIGWCGRCYTSKVPARRSEPVIVLPEAKPSLWRAGPTTFGLFGKLVVTALMAAIGVAAYGLAAAWVEVTGSAGLAFVLFIVAVYSFVAFVILRSVWRFEPPSRQPLTVLHERIVRIGNERVAATPRAPALAHGNR